MNLPVHGVTRRTGVLACLAIVCLLLLVHSSASSRPLIPLLPAVRFRTTSTLARYLAHPSERPARPLVSSTPRGCYRCGSLVQRRRILSERAAFYEREGQHN